MCYIMSNIKQIYTSIKEPILYEDSLLVGSEVSYTQETSEEAKIFILFLFY